MPKPRPLASKESAKRTLAHRLTRTADRLRQLYTRFGLRSDRVFLVWTRWTGESRGEGDEEVTARVELLPTPRVSDLTAIWRKPYAQGVLPDGTIRVDQISAGAYTADQLSGVEVPGVMPTAPRATRGENVGGTPEEPESDPRTDFFYEIVEDGRGDNPPCRERYRLRGGPSRNEGSLYFAVNLERVSEDTDRLGKPQVGDDDVAWT